LRKCKHRDENEARDRRREETGASVEQGKEHEDEKRQEEEVGNDEGRETDAEPSKQSAVHIWRQCSIERRDIPVENSALRNAPRDVELAPKVNVDVRPFPPTPCGECSTDSVDAAEAKPPSLSLSCGF
jgi:hypothetical protein